MELTAEHKKEAERRLVEIIIKALEQGDLKADEFPVVSSFILDKIKEANNHDSLMQFLRELSGKWRIFTPALVLESGEIKEGQKNEVAQNVLNLARSGKIDEALNLAKTANTP